MSVNRVPVDPASFDLFHLQAMLQREVLLLSLDHYYTFSLMCLQASTLDQLIQLGVKADDVNRLLEVSALLKNGAVSQNTNFFNVFALDSCAQLRSCFFQ